MYARLAIITWLCVMAWVGWAEAHGTSRHILGTVTAISDVQIDVKTQKGDSLSVRLTENTEFLARGKDTTATRPRVGDRVVIEASGEGAQLTATEVKFANAPEKTKSAP